MDSMYRRALITLSVLLIASQALATDPTAAFIWGQELCVVDPSTFVHATSPWQEQSTNLPANSTTTFTDATNKCSLQFTPASGAAEYYSRTTNLSSESVTCALMRLRVTTIPAGNARRRILSFEDGSGNTTGFLTVANSGASQFDLAPWYESEGNECAQATNNGTECTSDTECYSIDDADICGTSTYGTATNLDLNTWYVVGLEQDNTLGDAGDVRLKMYLGVIGLVVPYSEPTRPQGSCSETIGGFEHACGASSDCNGFCTQDSDSACCTGAGTGTCTCTTTHARTVSKVNIGTDETVAAASFDYLIDNVYVSDGSCSNALANARIHALHPNADTAPNSWTATGAGSIHADRVDDNSTSGPDDSTTYLEATSGSNIQEELGVTNLDLTETCSASVCGDSKLPCTDAFQCQQTGPAIPVVSQVSSIRKSSANSARTTSIRPSMVSTATLNGTTFLFSQNLPDFNYHPAIYMSSITQPSGGPWTSTAVDALSVLLTYNKGNCASSCNLRDTESLVEAWVELPTPVIPGVIIDNDGDGEDTVAFIGDSRINAPLEQNMLNGLLEATNIYDCATGGETIGDALANIDVIKEGGTTGHLACSALKGTTGRTVDLAVVMMTVNALRGYAGAPPSAMLACDNNSDCVGGGTCTANTCSGFNLCTGSKFTLPCSTNQDCGICSQGVAAYCEDDGGADQGQPCYCPQNAAWETAVGNTALYCITGDGGHNGDFGTVCTDSSDCACASSAECRGHTCSGSVCGQLASGAGVSCAVNATTPTTYCVSGCLNADGCPDGVCVAGNSVSAVSEGYRAVVEALEANGADVIIVPDPPQYQLAGPLDQTIVGVCTDTICTSGKIGQTCAANDDCTVIGCWVMNPALDDLSAWMKRLEVENADYHIINLPEWMSHCCPEGTMNRCLDDGVHTNETGSQCMADAMLKCITNESGSADGVCTGNVCSSGRTGSTCTVSADCDMYRCAF